MAITAFLIRLEQELHDFLKREAKQAGCSLNDLCVRRLIFPCYAASLNETMLAAVKLLVRMSGDRLAGIVVFGSVARREATATSDVDILVVLRADSTLDRALYRVWESDAPDGSEKLEPHFVRLPTLEHRVSGLWAEVAMDGLVILDRSGAITSYVQFVRRLIADGKLTRKHVHGQNYWIHTEAA